MAKKQVLVSSDQIDNYLQKSAKLNFVMTNRSVFLAYPISIKSGDLKVKNTKGHILHLPLAQIEEIWAEQKVN